ncbi:4Fe-4S binding domain-containing protein [Pseudoalteromonas denitrificans DSM 6059]|uniref:4Fe-4S binding domain-containing protein n=2 Tax=Pseudoalteromonas TaxID=53246 RepID=A0A1I1FPF7_9GAMM|nr:4Fe-4S binding domain-containing protein [Pseudoalteromonas denitrificans DSM 6059]
MTYQHARTVTRTLFFLLFLFAPLLNIFRFDLTLGHFIFFGQQWTLGLDSVLYGEAGAIQATEIIFLKVFLPAIAFISISLILIYKYGRIYCGWLCPHFSVVEMINQVMLKQLNRVTLWEKPSKQNNSIFARVVVAAVSVFMAFIWALGLLSYLMPPIPLLIDLVNFEVAFGSTIFLCVATCIFSFDFIFARHVFCKYGCALGLFQSLIWMANKQAMAVKFDRSRAKACRDCDKACDKACPMRLPTRNMKRAKFTCTQCAQCISACQKVQKNNPEGTLLNWVNGPEAIDIDRPAVQYKPKNNL